MSTATRACLAVLLAGAVLDGQASNKDPPPKIIDDVVLTQAYGGPIPLARETSTDFRNAVESACKTSRVESAGVLAAFAGIVIDWLFKTGIKRLNARVKKHLQAFAANYSNDLQFGDIFAKGWNADASGRYRQTCIVAQRVTCDAKLPDGTCTNPEAANSVAFLLNRSGPAIRVTPIASSLRRRVAKHAGQEPFVATYSLKIHAIGTGDEGGYRWDSGEAVAISEKKDLPAEGIVSFDKVFEGGPTEHADARWSEAKALPTPPVDGCKSYAAFEVTFAEVGQPKRYVKHFAEFLDANTDSVSKALGEAAKKKFKIGED